MSSLVKTQLQPLVPVAKFHLTDNGNHAALEGFPQLVEPESRTDPTAEHYVLQPSNEDRGETADEANPDFIGRLHHLKNIFRMSATKDQVSVMIHKVGTLLVLDDGPCGAVDSTDANLTRFQLLADESTSDFSPPERRIEEESQLMLAAMDHSTEQRLLLSAPPGLADLPPGLPDTELRSRLIVKNTFLDLASEEEDDCSLMRSRSAPAGPAESASKPEPYRVDGFSGSGPFSQKAPHPKAQVSTKETSEKISASWSLIPYNQPDVVECQEHGSCMISPRTLDLFQCKPQAVGHQTTTVLEAIRSLFSDIPPQPSRFGRSVEWRCGPYKILLGCDLVVFRSNDKYESSDYASFKLLSQGHRSEPSREERLDVYLENMMCDISKVVWGSHLQGQSITWRVFNTSELPAFPGNEDVQFDAKQLQDQGCRLLYFLRQKCNKEGGTYWLFREKNSSTAELFDLSGIAESQMEEQQSWQDSAAFRPTPSLAAPIASLCYHLAKALPRNSDQRQLLQKGLHLLEPVKEEHFGLYSTTALQLACSYMRSPVAAISDTAEPIDARCCAKTSIAEPPPAARLSVALRYLEGTLGLLAPIRDSSLAAELLLQAQVAYAECIVKLVKEACIPTYSTWLCEVQQSTQAQQHPGGKAFRAEINQIKRLSAAYLLWRLFWLCRAHRAISFMATEKREIECWTLDRDLCEIMGDTLYGLSRYPSDDIKDLLHGQMAAADGICRLVEEGLRSWGMRSRSSNQPEASSSFPTRQKDASKRLASPTPQMRQISSDDADQSSSVAAMFLSKLNPLKRGIGDRALLEDPLVRDDLRHSFWSEGRALQQSLLLYERATSRLKKVPSADHDAAGKSTKGRQAEEQKATLKVARKLAHLYNEEARAALVQLGNADSERVEELLHKAHQWMTLSGDYSNAGRVLLNLSELHARRAERPENAGGVEDSSLTEAQYKLFLRAVECCEEAARISDGELGCREGAFAHLRLGVHLSVRVPVQQRLAHSRRNETLAELADRHFGKALLGFDELKDEREVAVCHFHMADLVLQELRVPGMTTLPKARLASALRHARKSIDYWDRSGALQYAKDFISSHIRTARLLECQQKANSTLEAVDHLIQAETKLLALHREAAIKRTDSVRTEATDGLFLLSDKEAAAVPSLRREIGRLCQSGLRQGTDVEQLKGIYRRVLRNESFSENAPT